MSRSVAEHRIPEVWSMHGSFLDRVARLLVFRSLSHLKVGSLRLLDGHSTFSCGVPGATGNLHATIRVLDPRFYRCLAFGGSVGAGESYMAGFWDCDDLTTLVRILILNEKTLLKMEGGLAAIAVPFHRLYHWKNKNTRDGSRNNIQAHYDLGNAFYALLLDETMTYSCAFFEKPEMTLKTASTAKYDRICRKLYLSPSDHVLEIGSGWGGFAIHAALNYGCRVTALTISPAQFEWAQRRIREEGLEDRIRLILKDYRDITGVFDKLVSIEMIEAVGHHYLNAFFRQCSRLLKPGGMMALQAITIADQNYESHKQSVDFIKRYIFPGSTLTSVTTLCRSATQASDLRLFHLEDITPHYVTTLRHWRERFLVHMQQVRALGYPETFIRMWTFYLCYCEGGFAERYIGDVQAVFVKPEFRSGASNSVMSGTP